MKKFFKDLKEHATRIINHEKKKIIPLTKEEKINYNDQKVSYICKKEFDTIDTTKSSPLERKKHHEVRDHCHYTGNTEVLLIIFAIEDIKHPKKFL